MKIGLTGATGKLGRLVAEQLLLQKSPGDVALIVRKPEAAGMWEREGARVRYGDYDYPDSLEHAFAGLDKLLLISSSHQDDEVRLRQHTAAIQAARRAGVKHLIYTSVANPEKGRLPLHRMHLDTEQLIKESGMSYTLLRNAYYMDIVHFLRVREAAAGGVLLSPPGEWRFNTAARADLALAAAAVLTEAGHEGRTYELTAERAWTLADLARAVSEATGRRVVHRTDPAMQGGVYGLLPLSDMSKVWPDLRRLAGRPLQTVRDEVLRIFEGS